jgi:GNAT superfamily N-acetyltransferase
MPDPASTEAALRRRMEATLDHYHELGNKPREREHGWFLVDPTRPDVHDANHARRVRASTADEIDALLADMDVMYAAGTHRRIVIDLDTPDPVEARLALEGWTLDTTLQHLLEGPLPERAAPTGGAIRLADDDEGWSSMLELTRQDHVEEAQKSGREPWAVELTRKMVGLRRAKGPDVRAWLAMLDGAAVGMFSSMPGVDGVGLVEDLFVTPDARGRGVAQALIAHAVADARARGADAVIIGSVPDDWPKHLYARMGFRPRFVERAWLGHPGRETSGADT